MELLSVLRVIVRRWWIIALPVVVAAALTLPALLETGAPASGGFTTEIRYSAMQRMDAIPRQEGDYQDIWRSAELTIDAFTDWVRAGRFREEVAARAAELAITVESGSIGIAADNAASLGQLTISHSDAAVLTMLQQAAIDVLQTRSVDYFPQLGGIPADVTVLERGAVVAAPPPLTDRFAPFIRIGLGLLAGLGLAFLIEYLDQTVRRRDEIEEAGLPVLSSIPRA